MHYGFSKKVTLPFDQAIDKVTEELKKEGFGVLTTIDIKDTLKKKINVDVPRYTILGACNPHFSHQALQVETEIGLLLPCNVIVYEKDGSTFVSVFDPMIMEKIIDNPAMHPVAEGVQQKLRRVFDSM
ncbi:MAG: DUF302 domain-containing protein [Bacteroidota bacterium]|jgi:uncharacterized protein (DUF302 family)